MTGNNSSHDESDILSKFAVMLDERMAKMQAELNTSIDKLLDERVTKELNLLKEKMSLMEDRFAFMRYQATSGGIPREVQRAPSGNALLEPPYTWRRWR